MRPPLALALLLAACTGATKNDADTAPTDDLVETGDTSDAPGPDAACTEAGETWRPFDATAAGTDFDLPVGDFTLQTLDGPWTLSTAWSGCDQYVFILVDAQVVDTAQLLEARSAEFREMLDRSPTNVHYFWMNYSRGADAEARAQEIKDAIDAKLDRLDEGEAAWWRSRFHYVTEGARGGGGWVGDFVRSYGSSSFELWGFAIDRMQRLREAGYWSDPATGWETVPPRSVAYDAVYLEFEADREDLLAAEDATVVRVFDGVLAQDSGWAGVTSSADVTLPDLSGVDHLELDLTLTCTGHPDLQNCPAWDYLVYAYSCEPVDGAENCVEMGRFITTYWRPGRWLVDATPFLPEMKANPQRRFKFYTTQPYLLTLDLRFSNRGSGVTPFAREFLWSGGAWDENYTSNHAPIAFTPPAGTRKVELVAITSGHGFGADTENCAEFCNHQHKYTVAGQSWMQEFPMAGDALGCADQVAEGTVPNQAGTWPFGRGGWCPGKEVDPWVVDITDAVDLSGENTITYEGLFEGAPFVPDYNVANSTGFPGRIDLATYLVYSR